MTLNVNQPSDQVLNSELPSYIRALAVAINALEVGTSSVITTVLSVAAGSTFLTVGSDLSSVAIEIVVITGAGPATISQIRSGAQAQVKIFIFQNSQISLTDGTKANGALYLNQLPAGGSFAAQQDDVIAFTNIGGDGSTEFGYWKEIFRQVSVK